MSMNSLIRGFVEDLKFKLESGSISSIPFFHAVEMRKGDGVMFFIIASLYIYLMGDCKTIQLYFDVYTTIVNK